MGWDRIPVTDSDTDDDFPGSSQLTNGKVEIFTHDRAADHALEEIVLTLQEIREDMLNDR